LNWYIFVEENRTTLQKDAWGADLSEQQSKRRAEIKFKRRTKSMEIMAVARSCYTHLAFIALKMELHWKSNPIGKVRKNLLLWKNFRQE